MGVRNRGKKWVLLLFVLFEMLSWFDWFGFWHDASVCDLSRCFWMMQMCATCQGVFVDLLGPGTKGIEDFWVGWGEWGLLLFVLFEMLSW